jgi:hypothetical protein
VPIVAANGGLYDLQQPYGRVLFFGADNTPTIVDNTGDVSSIAQGVDDAVYYLTNGSLYQIGQAAALVNNVANIAQGVNDAVYYLTDTNLYQLGQSTPLVSNVYSIAQGVNNTVYYLQNGSLYQIGQATAIDNGVASFAIGSDGTLYYLTSGANPAGSGNLCRYSPGSTPVLLQGGVWSFVITPDGTTIDTLQSDGSLLVLKPGEAPQAIAVPSLIIPAPSGPPGTGLPPGTPIGVVINADQSTGSSDSEDIVFSGGDPGLPELNGKVQAAGVDGQGNLIVLSNGRLYDYGNASSPGEPIQIAQGVQAFDVASNGQVVAAINGNLFEQMQPGQANSWAPVNSLAAFDPASWLSNYFLPALTALQVPDSTGQEIPVEFSLQISGSVVGKDITFQRDIEGNWVQISEPSWASGSKIFPVFGPLGPVVDGNIGPNGVSVGLGVGLEVPGAGVQLKLEVTLPANIGGWLNSLGNTIDGWFKDVADWADDVETGLANQLGLGNGDSNDSSNNRSHWTGDDSPGGTISDTIYVPAQGDE